MLVTGNSIYQGSSAITKVYQGADLIWPAVEPSPEWPSDYYYPGIPQYNYKCLGLFYGNISSGYTFNWDWYQDDDEGEGGGGSIVLGRQVYDVRSSEPHTITANTQYKNEWLYMGGQYDVRFNNYGNLLSGATAMALQSRSSYGSSYALQLPSGVTFPNIELLVIPKWQSSAGSVIDPPANIIASFPNLRYLSLNSDDSYTGRTIALTGSTAWTAESMKFTEWYCPGTTFIIENNSWWRQRIDWDIAAERNITFKDGNGNIITQ